MVRKDGESYLEYIKRITNKCEDKQITYSEWGDYILGAENVYSNDNCRKAFYVVNKLMDKIDSTCEVTDDKIFKELELLKREVAKERMKFQTEKLEYNRWLREEARDELFEEKVINSIRDNLNKPPIPKKIEVVHNKRGGQLNIADSHFGKEYKIFGLNDEVINEYSPEIYYERMELLYNETLDIIKKEGLTELHINNLGDHIEGFIRNSQLWTLRYGATDSSILFGNYLGKWLNKLSNDVKVIYNQTDGNHDEFRLLDGKKGEHSFENAGKIVTNCILLVNEGNPNFELRSNKTGFIFDTIVGYNFLGIHGEVKDLSRAIKDYEHIYNIRIDYLVAGHKHFNEYMNCGVRRGVIGVASIVGSDDFSMRIRKSSDASSSLLIFEEGKGKVLDYTIVLN